MELNLLNQIHKVFDGSILFKVLNFNKMKILTISDLGGGEIHLYMDGEYPCIRLKLETDGIESVSYALKDVEDIDLIIQELRIFRQILIERNK